VQLLRYVISSSVSYSITGLFNAVWLMPHWNQHPVLQPGYREMTCFWWFIVAFL